MGESGSETTEPTKSENPVDKNSPLQTSKSEKKLPLHLLSKIKSQNGEKIWLE